MNHDYCLTVKQLLLFFIELLFFIFQFPDCSAMIFDKLRFLKYGDVLSLHFDISVVSCIINDSVNRPDVIVWSFSFSLF